jgi:hypothetical protein
MKDLQETEKRLEEIRSEPGAWLAQANYLKISAGVILLEWEKVRKHPYALRMMQKEMVAYSQAFMLLTALAFENLFKGILYGRDPNNKLARTKGGHGISQMAGGITNLVADESDLFERLERYLIWAGRYQIPMTAQAFLDQSEGKISIRIDDPERIGGLFESFISIMNEESTKRKQQSEPSN